MDCTTALDVESRMEFWIPRNRVTCDRKALSYQEPFLSCVHMTPHVTRSSEISSAVGRTLSSPQATSLYFMVKWPINMKTTWTLQWKAKKRVNCNRKRFPNFILNHSGVLTQKLILARNSCQEYPARLSAAKCQNAQVVNSRDSSY